MEDRASLFFLSVDERSKELLTKAAKWAGLFAWAGMVALAFVMANGVHTLSLAMRFNDNSQVAETIGTTTGFSLFAILPFLALVFALRFTNAVQKLLVADDPQALNRSFQNLKIYFRYIAVLAVIAAALAAVSFAVTFVKSPAPF